MYTELIIRPVKQKDTIFYPEQARKLAAKALNDSGIPNLFFNRDKDGKPLQGRTPFKGVKHIESNISYPPAIFFDGGKGYIRIYGLGLPGRELLHNYCGIIAQKIGQQTGVVFSTDLKHGDCSISKKGTKLYTMRRMVVEKNPSKINKYIHANIHDVHQEIEREIYRGLVSQAQWLDQNIENNESKLASYIPDIGTLDIDIVEGEATPIEINKNNYAAGFKNIVFSMNLDLSGPWLCGHLKSRGYGLIRKYIEQRRST